MSVFALIKRLWAPSPEKLHRMQIKQKRYILLILAQHKHEGNPIVLFERLYRDFRAKYQLSTESFIIMLNELVASGDIQKIDGGNKKLTPLKAHYVISNDGYNSLRFPR